MEMSFCAHKRTVADYKRKEIMRVDIMQSLKYGCSMSLDKALEANISKPAASFSPICCRTF